MGTGVPRPGHFPDSSQAPGSEAEAPGWPVAATARDKGVGVQGGARAQRIGVNAPAKQAEI